MCGIWFCPESPRWLMKSGKVAQGFQSMVKLRDHEIIGARDFYYSYILYQEELKVAGGLGYFSRMRDCFTVPRIRRANYGASTVMIAQQMCGINSKPLPHKNSNTMLIVCSHLLLQFYDLHKRRLYSNPGLVRFARLWCDSGRVHDTHIVPHRHQG